MNRNVNTGVLFAVINPVFPSVSVFALGLQFSLESHKDVCPVLSVCIKSC